MCLMSHGKLKLDRRHHIVSILLSSALLLFVFFAYSYSISVIAYEYLVDPIVKLFLLLPYCNQDF